MVQCVQQFFRPSKYPVSNHPLWDTLLDRLDGNGWHLSPEGKWIAKKPQVMATISSEDFAIAEGYLVRLRTPPASDELKAKMIERIALMRSTVHLREAFLYLQLQADGVDLPAIGEDVLGGSFVALEKHQKDALCDEFERRGLFEAISSVDHSND